MASERSHKKQMSLFEQGKAIVQVAKLSFLTAPGSVLFKLSGAVVDALLPLVTAYFAALTTTALVEAYGDDDAAAYKALLYVVLTALLGLISLAWGSVDRYIQSSMRYKIEARVSDQMYEQFLSLDFWRYDDKQTADLYDKAQKFAQFFAWIFDRLASIVSRLISMIASVVALFWLNAWLAAAIFVAIIPGVYLQFKLSRAQIAHWNTNVDTRHSRNMIEWSLLQPNSATELRLYGMVKHLLKLRAKLRDKDEKILIEFEKKFIGKRLASDLLQTLAEVGSLVWVTLEIVSHHLPVGQFVYVQQVVSRALTSATGFIAELSTIDEDVANLFEYQEFMQLERPDVRPSKLKAPPETIRFENVSFHYPNSETVVLSDINLEIRKHQNVAIVGENGAGKSTLVKLLSGIYSPTKGRVLLDGEPIENFEISSWHSKLAFLQQDFTRYSFANVRDNVLFGDISKHDISQMRAALDDSESSQFVKKLPRRQETMIDNWMEDSDGNKGVNLSGGQWQRLALARNFYRDAPIILLDEPTSAIDALAETRIFSRLFSEKDKTIITISHRFTTVKKADYIYMMKEGRIVERGTAKELVAARGEFYKMFESQI